MILELLPREANGNDDMRCGGPVLKTFISAGPAFELVFKIRATSLRREGSSVGPTCTSRGRYKEFPWWLFLQ
jgi:hypothetical protein